MFERQFPGKSPDEVLSNNGVCSECLTLPVAARKKLADKVVEEEDLDDHRRDLMRERLKKHKN
jgi:hypothetical protein